LNRKKKRKGDYKKVFSARLEKFSLLIASCLSLQADREKATTPKGRRELTYRVRTEGNGSSFQGVGIGIGMYLHNGMKEAKMFKRGLLLIAGVFTFSALLASPALAQQAPRIAAVDLQRAFESSAEGRTVITQLRQKEQTIIGELDKFDKQILSLETKLKTQRLTLTEEAQQKLGFELETAKLQRKRVEEDSTKEFQRLQFSLISKLRNEVLAVIEGYAKEQQISLVFDLTAPSVALFCEPGLDLTAEIIRRYDTSKTTK